VKSATEKTAGTGARNPRPILVGAAMASDPEQKSARRAVRIGKYEVLQHIATGGMGAVYKALDTELNRVVALKVLSPEMGAKPAMLERFRREARHAARLRHENIVTIYECGSQGSTHFLALEYVDGSDLGDYIDKKGKLDPEEARLITLQAARALDHAHQVNIIHRDIKPSNFMLTRSTGKLIVKLTDLGLAREMGDEDFRVTRAGTTVGTIDYISPEQARDSRAADIRSDIYSLGCTLYHMLAGRPPFSEGGLTERLYKHIEERPVDVRELNPATPDPLWLILERMLAKKPEERYATPADLIKDLTDPDAVAAPTPVRSLDVLAGLAEGEEVKPRSKGRKSRPIPVRARDSDHGHVSQVPRARRGTGPRRSDETETIERAAAPTLFSVPTPTVWSWVLGGLALLVVGLAALVVALVFWN
jgi:serine/threonine-protein kinase